METKIRFESSRMGPKVVYDASQSLARFAREVKTDRERRYVANWMKTEKRK